MGGGGGLKGVELDPLQMANDTNKPLISKLLAVPSLRARYLAYVREIAEKHLDWAKLGPSAEKYHALIAADVKADTRKLESTEGFLKGLVNLEHDYLHELMATADAVEGISAFLQKRPPQWKNA